MRCWPKFSIFTFHPPWIWDDVFNENSGFVLDMSLGRFLLLFFCTSPHSPNFRAKHQNCVLCVCIVYMCCCCGLLFSLLIFCINRTNEQYRICLYVIYGAEYALHLLFGRLKPNSLPPSHRNGFNPIVNESEQAKWRRKTPTPDMLYKHTKSLWNVDWTQCVSCIRSS